MFVPCKDCLNDPNRGAADSPMSMLCTGRTLEDDVSVVKYVCTQCGLKATVKLNIKYERD